MELRNIEKMSSSHHQQSDYFESRLIMTLLLTPDRSSVEAGFKEVCFGLITEMPPGTCRHCSQWKGVLTKRELSKSAIRMDYWRHHCSGM